MKEEKITIIKNGVEVVLTEKRLRDLTSKFLELCASEATLHDDFSMSTKMVDMLLKAKMAWFPATQKNLNVNIKSFDEKIAKWMEARNEMNKAQEEGIKVFEIQ